VGGGIDGAGTVEANKQIHRVNGDLHLKVVRAVLEAFLAGVTHVAALRARGCPHRQ
jgi:hypothetical protein